jgi:cytochrome c1
MRPRLLAALAACAVVAVAAAPATADAKKKKKVPATFQGIVERASATSQIVVINVTGTTESGKKARGKAWRFNLKKADVVVGDVNQDGQFDLNDVAAGHVVSVIARVRKRGKLPRTIRAREFKALSAIVTLPTAPPTGPLVP